MFIVLFLVLFSIYKKCQSRKCVNYWKITFLNRHSGHCHVYSSTDWAHLSNPSLANARQDVMMNESCKKSPSSDKLNWSSFFAQTSMHDAFSYGASFMYRVHNWCNSEQMEPPGPWNLIVTASLIAAALWSCARIRTTDTCVQADISIITAHTWPPSILCLQCIEMNYSP